MDAHIPEQRPSSAWTIALLDGFELRKDESPIGLTRDEERLVAFLALSGQRVIRSHAAGCLWIDQSQDRALGNLRSAVWRLRRRAEGLIDANTKYVSLLPEATVDVEELTAASRQVLDGSPELQAGKWFDPDQFVVELLPGWSEEWMIVDRERLRQRCLHTLEVLADIEMARHDYPRAARAALDAVTIDPLRESATRRLVSAFLADGNDVAAVHRFHQYAKLLDAELGLQPSRELANLVA